MSKHEPEYKNYDLPEYVIAMFEYVINELDRVYFNINQKERELYDEYNIEGIEYRDYFWCNYDHGDSACNTCDEKFCEKPNFEFDGVKIYWYKYIGRGMSCNIEQSSDKWVIWFNKLIEHIRSKDNEYE
jgi:hypothetical protein